jgi:hypothetical protein
MVLEFVGEVVKACSKSNSSNLQQRIDDSYDAKDYGNESSFIRHNSSHNLKSFC